MIKTRAERKASTLLRRRKIAIIASVAVVLVLSVIVAALYSFLKTSTPYYDVDGQEYIIKQIDGVYVMCRKDGQILPLDAEFGYYRTDAGTFIQLDSETGEVKERVIPDYYDPTLSETVEYDKISVFDRILSKNISAIKVYNNEYEPDGFTLMRYNKDTFLADMNSDFSLMYSKIDSLALTLSEEMVASFYMDASYVLATEKIDPTAVAEKGYGEYGLIPETRTRVGWLYRIVITVDGTERVVNVRMRDGKILSDEEIQDPYEPTYDMLLPSIRISMSEAMTLAKNLIDPKRDAKLKYSGSVMAYTETYEYSPSYYTIAGYDTDGNKVSHTMIIGDKLINGGGYYAQYVNYDVEKNEYSRRDAVYVIPATVENTLLAPAKYLVDPIISYPMSSNNYYDVEDFTINKKNQNGVYDKVVSFTYLDIEDRRDTIEGIHPYKFSTPAFEGYRPNYDNISSCLTSLLAEPTINGIAVLSPTAEQKIAYGISSPLLDENGEIVRDEKGNIQSKYDSEYVISFNAFITDDDGERVKIKQTMYISEANTAGNYYVYTIMDFDSANMSFDTICEVSASTLSFLNWSSPEWVYNQFLEIKIQYVKEIVITTPSYNISFNLNHGKVEDSTTLGVSVEDSKGNKFSTFDVLDFKDKWGNRWIITPTDVRVYTSDGEEKKPSSRHFEYNSIGDQVQVIDEQITAEDGRRIRVTKDYIDIVGINGEKETLLRHHSTLFKDLFSLIISTNIVEEYPMTEEEEAALIADADKYIATFTIKDTEGGEQKADFYSLTARKAYIRSNGCGGFYVSSRYLEKVMSSIDLFLEGKLIEVN